MTIKLSITDIAFGGDGVGRTDDGLTVFVPFTAIGDQIETDIVNRRKSYGRASGFKLLQPSPDRTEPKCPVFGHCGGCRYQHVNYLRQLEIKGRQLFDCLSRIGRIRELPVPPPAISGPPYNYRNKLTLHPHPREQSYGFKAVDQTSPLPIRDCPLALPEINNSLPEILNNPMVRQNLKAVNPASLIVRKAVDSPVHWGLSNHPSDSWLRERLGGHCLELPFTTFWQVNQQVADKLTDQVKLWFRAANKPFLVDIYAGIGRYSLTFGSAVAHGWLLEKSPDFPHNAKTAHAMAGLGNRDFLAGAAEKNLPALLTRQRKKLSDMFVIVNPPRQGCEPQILTTLNQSRPACIAYVSCNPATMARDLKSLVNQGLYKIKDVMLADMFPQTAHFESAVMLSLSDS